MRFVDYEDVRKLNIFDKIYVASYRSIRDHHVRPHVINITSKKESWDLGMYMLTLSGKEGLAEFNSKGWWLNEYVAYFTTAQECIAWYRKRLELDIVETAKQPIPDIELLDALLDEYIAVS